MNIPKMPTDIPMPPVNPPKKESKVKRLYEDDMWVIDLVGNKVRISYFEDCHFVDDITISEKSFRGILE